jgi:hypothetical protein
VLAAIHRLHLIGGAMTTVRIIRIHNELLVLMETKATLKCLLSRPPPGTNSNNHRYLL